MSHLTPAFLSKNSSSSLLDRRNLLSPEAQALSETQDQVDQIVSSSAKEMSNLKTAAAMLGAGLAGRFARIGAMVSAPGQTFLSQLIRGASHLPALAAESAAFVGIERGFHSLAGHKPTQPFTKEWAKSALTLGSLKAFGGFSRGQNIVLQHLFTDLGLVAAQHAGHAVQVTDKPQGTLAQQMVMAEAMNWQMKGSLSLLHGLSPKLAATERGMDLFLKARSAPLFSKGQSRPVFSSYAFAEGTQIAFAENAKLKEAKESHISQTTGGSGQGDGSVKAEKEDFVSLAKAAAKGDSESYRKLRALSDPMGTRWHIDVTELAEASKTDPEALRALWYFAEVYPNARDTLLDLKGEAPLGSQEFAEWVLQKIRWRFPDRSPKRLAYFLTAAKGLGFAKDVRKIYEELRKRTELKEAFDREVDWLEKQSDEELREKVFSWKQRGLENKKPQEIHWAKELAGLDDYGKGLAILVWKFNTWLKGDWGVRNFIYSEPLLLQALAHGPCYGLDLVSRVKELTSGEVDLKAGTLYPSLRRLLEKELAHTVGGEQSEMAPERIYYQLTPKGLEQVERDRHRFRQLLKLFGISD